MSNYKRIEEMLRNYNMYKVSIINMKKRIALIEMDVGVSGISYEETSTSETHKIGDLTADAAINRIERKKSIEYKLKRVTLKIEMLDACINELDDIQKKIIEEHYIEGKEWWQVAAMVDLTEQHCMRIRQQAIKKLVIGYFGECSLNVL